jgi:hypothetical protein
MAKYERTRTYVVETLGTQSAIVGPPKGRKFGSFVVDLRAFSTKTINRLKVGSKVTLYRFSNQYSTWFAPKA